MGQLSCFPQRVGSESFYTQSLVRELYAETPQTSVTVIFRLVINCLTSITLIVLGTINLQFQPFIPIAVWSAQNCGSSFLGYSLIIMQLTSPPDVLEVIRQLTGYDSEYL